ncbi:hypothetical protein B0H14DRAFT_2803195 [Mycena olivaceomarginata]|nr:hypothetical protein B0H14DRAFT_2803195 [Mycena olivaceomarginata]
MCRPQMHYRALVLLSSLHCSCLSLASISVLNGIPPFITYLCTAQSFVPRSPPAALAPQTVIPKPSVGVRTFVGREA